MQPVDAEAALDQRLRYMEALLYLKQGDDNIATQRLMVRLSQNLMEIEEIDYRVESLDDLAQAFPKEIEQLNTQCEEYQKVREFSRIFYRAPTQVSWDRCPLHLAAAKEYSIPLQTVV